MSSRTSVYQLLKTTPEAGFKVLLAYDKGIKKWMKQNSASNEECKDIMHDAIIAFYKYVQKKDFNVDIPEDQLLFGIAKNIWHKELRKKRNMPESELPESIMHDSDLEDILEREQQFKVMNLTLDKLGEPCKELLFLYYYKKLSMENIAIKLGFRNAHVAKSMKYQCLAKAHKLINP